MRSYRLNLNLTGVIVLVALGVLVPVMLSTAAGIVSIVIARDTGGIITGVLVISFAAAAAGSALIAVVLTGRKSRLARRQADFIANVSHELRTPLSAIRLYTQTLQTPGAADDPDRLAECLAVILRETEWLDMMIDRVLTWRASSKDALPLNMTTAPLESAVRGAVTRFTAMVESRSMHFTADVNGRLPVRHDADAINAVVLNLLTNAWKYTGADKQIGLRLYDDEQRAVMEVRDNGIGLTPKEIKNVFQPFYRAENPASGAGGVGLGLAIARYIVERHGGTIRVQGEKDKGSVFTIELPAAAEKG